MGCMPSLPEDNDDYTTLPPTPNFLIELQSIFNTQQPQHKTFIISNFIKFKQPSHYTHFFKFTKPLPSLHTSYTTHCQVACRITNRKFLCKSIQYTTSLDQRT